MKKYILITIVTFTSLAARAQKLEKPDIDKITGDTMYYTKEQTLANPMALVAHYLAVSTMKAKGVCVLYLHPKDGVELFYQIQQEDKTIIKFTDGKLLTLTPASDHSSSLITSDSGTGSECLVSFELTPADVAAFLGGKVSFIRINTSKGAFDYDVRDGKSELIKKHIELVLKK